MFDFLSAVVSKSFKESTKDKLRVKKLFVSHTNTSVESSPNNKCQGKVTPPRSPLKVISDASRSPLGSRNIDVNSPRNIVQRKQMTKLGMLQLKTQNKSFGKSPVKYQVFCDDKENMDVKK